MRSEFFFAMFVILIIAAFIIKGLNIYFTEPPPVNFDNYNWIGAIDYNDDGQISQDSIMQGEDILLTILPPNENSPQQVSNLDDLKKLEGHANDVISASDPGFRRIRGLYFPQDGAGARLAPLRQMGIYGIRLNTLTDKPHQEAILTDSSARPLMKPPPQMRLK